MNLNQNNKDFQSLKLKLIRNVFQFQNWKSFYHIKVSTYQSFNTKSLSFQMLDPDSNQYF